MAKTIGNVEPAQPEVRAAGPVGSVNYSGTFTQLAQIPTLLGELGTNVAQSAANRRAEILGAEAGQHPEGDIRLPAITEADRHYQAAYLSQAQNTTNVQLNQLMGDADIEVGKHYRLSADVLNAYGQQVGQGIQDILANAPREVRERLAPAYANQLIKTRTQLQLKMIGQQHKDALDMMAHSDQINLQQIYDAAISGDVELAKQLHQEQLDANEKNLKLGMKSEAEAAIDDETSKLSFYTGLSINAYNSAKNKSGEAAAEYLSHFTNPANKPPELTQEQWQSVGKQTVNYAQYQDSLNARERSNVLSDINRKIQENSLGTYELTKDDLLNAAKNPALTPADVDNLMLDFLKSKAQKESKTQAQRTLDMHWKSTLAHTRASADLVNHVFDRRVQELDKTAEGNHYEHMAAVAIQAGAPVPAFINTLKGLSSSVQMEDVEVADQMYKRVLRDAPQNLKTLPKDVVNNLHAYDTYNRLNPGRPDLAFAKYQALTQRLSPEDKKIIDDDWQDYRQKNFGTPQKRQAYAQQLLDNDGWSSLPLQNSAEASNYIQQLFRDNVYLYKGDYEAAKLQTEKDVSALSGETNVNGIPQKTLFSLEKELNLGPAGTFAVQQDIVSQVQEKLKPLADAYSKGDMYFKYEIIAPEHYSTDRLKMLSQKVASEKNAAELLNTKMQAELDGIDAKLAEFSPLRFGARSKEFMNLLAKKGAIRKKYGAQIEEQEKELGVNPFESHYISTLRRAITDQHKPIKIRRTYRAFDGKEYTTDLNLAINPDYSAEMGLVDGKAGPFEITIYDENGMPEQIPDITGPPAAKIMYNADGRKIQENDKAFSDKYITFDMKMQAFEQQRGALK